MGETLDEERRLGRKVRSSKWYTNRVVTAYACLFPLRGKGCLGVSLADPVILGSCWSSSWPEIFLSGHAGDFEYVQFRQIWLVVTFFLRTFDSYWLFSTFLLSSSLPINPRLLISPAFGAFSRGWAASAFR